MLINTLLNKVKGILNVDVHINAYIVPKLVA